MGALQDRSTREYRSCKNLRETLAVLREDKGMQTDLARLNKSCCVPQEVSALEGAPMPTILEVLASSSC